MKSEKRLVPTQPENFTLEIKDFRDERRYWAKIQRTVTGVTHKVMRKVWNGHQHENWGILDRDVRVHIRKVDEKIFDHKRRADKRREQFLGDQAEVKEIEGGKNAANAVRGIKKK